MTRAELPFIDRHDLRVQAGSDVVWRALAAVLAGPRVPGTQLYTHAVGAEPRSASGRLFAVGSTLPGFRVTEVDPRARVQLAGRHRFARYALTFTLDPDDGATLLRASTHSDFPGVHGRLYKGVVIDSGAHQMLVRSMLHQVRRRAEGAG